MKTLLDTVDVAIVAIGPDGRSTVVNQTARNLRNPWEDDDEALVGVQARLRLPDDALAQADELQPVSSALRDGLRRTQEMLLPGPQGDRHLLVRAAPLLDESGQVVGAIGAIHDVTAFKAQEAALCESVAFHDAVLAASPDVLAVMDLDTGSTVWTSGSFTDQLGYHPDEVAAMGSSIYPRLVHPEDLPGNQAINVDARGLRDGQVIDARYRLLHADGSLVTFHRRVTPFHRAKDGTVRQVLVLARDVSEAVRMKDELRAAALHDPLTGLPNRRLLTDRLDSALRRALRAGQQVTVLFVDLDGFKGVNDSGGHEVGDDVLIATAERLSKAVRPTTPLPGSAATSS